jgi:hypothetical protein
MLERFLSLADASRVEQTLQTLMTHGIGSWVLTGGLAVGIHCLLHRRAGHIRPLNDIDFVTNSFDDVPDTLAQGLSVSSRTSIRSARQNHVAGGKHV